MKSKLIVYGKHSAKTVLQNPRRQIEKVFCTKNTVDFVNKILKGQAEAIISDKAAIERLLRTNGLRDIAHQDIVVMTYKLNQPHLHELFNANFLVLLDEMQDSQNIGAIIRSSALFNVDAVISTLHNSPDENSHIIKAACGAFEYLPFLKVVNLSQTINLLKEQNFWVIGMSCAADDDVRRSLAKFSKNEKIAVVVGNEEAGMRKMVAKSCDFLAKIPTNTNRGVDSLNASNAAAIFLYEISKVFSQALL